MAGMAAASVSIIIVLIVIVVLWTIVWFGRTNRWDGTEKNANHYKKLLLIIAIEIIAAIVLAQMAIGADHVHHRHHGLI